MKNLFTLVTMALKYNFYWFKYVLGVGGLFAINGILKLCGVIVVEDWMACLIIILFVFLILMLVFFIKNFASKQSLVGRIVMIGLGVFVNVILALTVVYIVIWIPKPPSQLISLVLKKPPISNVKFIEKEAEVIPVSEPIDVVTHDQPTAIKTENNYKVGSTPVPVYTPPSKPPHRQIPKTDQGKLNQRVHQDGVYYFYIGDNRQDAPSNNWVNKNVQENLSDLSEPISLEDKNFSSINHAVLFTELPTVMPENMDNAVLMNKSVKFKVLETFPIDDQHFKYRSHVWAKIKIIEG